MNMLFQFAGDFLLAVVSFFAFPAIQFLFLKSGAKKQGKPELWYLPKYGFRLVIRNLPGKHVLSDLRYRTIIRTTIPKSQGSSVATYQDENLVEQQDFFLLPGNDQVLLSFRLKETKNGDLLFIHTDKLGKEKQIIKVKDFDKIISCYIATVENKLNFDMRVANQVEIKSATLLDIMQSIQTDNEEQSFNLDVVKSIN